VQTPRVLRSTSLRLAIIYAGLFLGSSLLMVLFTYWTTVGYLNRQIDSAIQADIDAVTDRLRTDGIIGATAAVEERLRDNPDGERLFLLSDAARRRLAGNLATPPRAPGGDIVPAQSELAEGVWREGELATEHDRVTARFALVRLAGGYRLLVGRDVKDRGAMRLLIVDALIGAAAMTALLAILGSLLFRRLLLGKIESISRTGLAIVQGDMTRRVPLTGAADEFDLLAETVNVMLDQIAGLMDGVREVSNSIAHDLRTPLARVRGRLEEIAGAPGLPRERLDDVQQAIAQVDGMMAVFEALLRIAEIDSGARREAFAEMDIAAVVADVAEFYGPLAQEREIACTAAVGAPLAMVGDRHMISQAIANLLDNAIKYTPAGGTVAVRVARVADRAEISVADSGPGIPDAEKPRVSERFYRLERARGAPGSGLGLSLVAAVARLHGGALRLEDNRPHGLVAVLTLHAAADAPLRAAAE
jgi:signal transduction histidine kinase